MLFVEVYILLCFDDRGKENTIKEAWNKQYILQSEEVLFFGR